MSNYSITPIVPVKRNSRPVHPYANGLPPGVTIEDRGPAGIFLVDRGEQRTTGREDRPLPTPPVESRVDSMQDADIVRAGGELWYSKHLKAAKAAKAL